MVSDSAKKHAFISHLTGRVLALMLVAMIPWRSDAADYLIEHWGTADGLPVNAVNRIMLDRTGFLWMATFDGLVRFDGHRFVTFAANEHPEFSSNRVLELLQTDDGLIWLHVDPTTLLSFDGRQFRRYGDDDGLPDSLVWGIHRDTEGTLWVSTERGLARRSNQSAIPRHRPKRPAAELLPRTAELPIGDAARRCRCRTHC
ncbi:hypothetical protein OS187_03950 [Xanthomonadaceae bacterium JHOS43]|nr:hypothetical protein [Xanthomonadaceae bacterium JHOS43]MCX7562075.1 hypothetical protein [Xanthomonadaceae bacterium XH05]